MSTLKGPPQSVLKTLRMLPEDPSASCLCTTCCGIPRRRPWILGRMLCPHAGGRGADFKDMLRPRGPTQLCAPARPFPFILLLCSLSDCACMLSISYASFFHFGTCSCPFHERTRHRHLAQPAHDEGGSSSPQHMSTLKGPLQSVLKMLWTLPEDPSASCLYTTCCGNPRRHLWILGQTLCLH
jgi:hypothetical protein